MKKLILPFILVNFVVSLFLIYNMSQESATTANTTSVSADNCYKFLVNTKKQRDDITYLLDDFAVHRYTLKAADESKYHQLYWQLSADKKIAASQIASWQSKGLFKDKQLDLVYAGKMWSINIATFDDELKAKKELEQMSQKAKSLGGQWAIFPASASLFEITAKNAPDKLVGALKEKYSNINVSKLHCED